LDLPKETNAFDFDTISDVIIKISYTLAKVARYLAGRL
jgi:hypothetical protein